MFNPNAKILFTTVVKSCTSTRDEEAKSEVLKNDTKGLSQIFKGAPMGGKNAAGTHNGRSAVPKAHTLRANATGVVQASSIGPISHDSALALQKKAHKDLVAMGGSLERTAGAIGSTSNYYTKTGQGKYRVVNSVNVSSGGKAYSSVSTM